MERVGIMAAIKKVNCYQSFQVLSHESAALPSVKCCSCTGRFINGMQLIEHDWCRFELKFIGNLKEIRNFSRVFTDWK